MAGIETSSPAEPVSATSAGGEPATSRLQIAGAVGASLLAGAVTLAIFGDLGFGLRLEDLLTAAMFLGVMAVVVVLPGRLAAATLVSLLAVWLIGYAAYAWIPDGIELPLPVSEAVGGAAFFMSSYVDQQVAGGLLVGAVLAACATFAVLGGRGAPATPGPAAPADHSAGGAWPPRRLALITAGAVAVIALTLLPDLHKALIDGTRGPLPVGWDEANLMSWDAFQQRGLSAMKDFWYPYGASWILSDFPTGPAARWLWQAGLLVALGWALWRLAGPKPVRIALCLLAFVAISGFDRVDSLSHQYVWRYLPALVVAACYAAVGPLHHTRLTRGHLIFAAVCAAVGAMEADVLIAGLGGAAFVGLGELALNPALRTWRSLRAGLADLAPVGAGIAVMLAYWAMTDTLAENVRWFTSARAVSASSGASQEVFGALVGLQADPSQVTLLVTVPALMLVVAFFVRRAGGEAQTAASRLLLAGAGVATIFLAKHLVRPQGPLVAILPLVALMWTAILLWRARLMRTAIASGLFLGAVLGMLQAQAAVKPSQYVVRALATPVRAVRDLQLVLDRGKVHAAGNGRFAPERFSAIPEKQFIADKLAGGLSGTGNDRFAVLGDAQILYVLFGQDPPGHISLYDAAPVPEQRRWIDGVRELQPERLIWRRDLAIDGVVYDVRDPLVFAYAIANYVPEVLSEPMDVLKRRRPDERLAERYWRARLGVRTDVGGIPSYSHGDAEDRCTGGPGCAPYAIVKGHGRRTGDKVVVELDDTVYRVAFSTRKGVDSYAIRLDRLWFWPFAGGAKRLSVATPGWTVERAGVKAGDDLY